jgi:hypothetical protein
MSKFYTFEDEVPKHARVSTFEDCENCDGFKGDDCTDAMYCLIEEPPIPFPHPMNDE